MHNNTQPLTDSEGQIVHCERCGRFPATQEICYHDRRYSLKEGLAWDSVCADCAREAHARGEIIR